MGIYKVWSAGSGTLVITIGHHNTEALQIKEGDYLEIPVIKKIEKKEKEVKEEDENIETKKRKTLFK